MVGLSWGDYQSDNTRQNAYIERYNHAVDYVLLGQTSSAALKRSSHTPLVGCMYMITKDQV